MIAEPNLFYSSGPSSLLRTFTTGLRVSEVAWLYRLAVRATCECPSIFWTAWRSPVSARSKVAHVWSIAKEAFPQVTNSNS